MELPKTAKSRLMAPTAQDTRWELLFWHRRRRISMSAMAETAGVPAAKHSASLLRIYLGEMDRYKSQPLYEAIVLKAREMHLAGATILRGPLGYGKSARLHTAKIMRLSEDLPIVIEIVDLADKIDGFLPILSEMMNGGLATLEQVQIFATRRAD